MPGRFALAVLIGAFALDPLGLDLPVAGAAGNTSQLKLQVRTRLETSPGSGRYHALSKQVAWNPKQTAIIVCDMWNLHHCLNATRRGAEMAPRMNRVLQEARQRGVTIIHAPSSCMASYDGHPARLRAINTPRSSNLPEDIGSWCYKIPAEERGTYPLDQSDGGEDDDPAEHAAWARRLASMGLNPGSPWTKQTELLEIDPHDYITDSGEETWSIMEQRGIDNVILLGVHTNMCVLGRPFGLRQMAKNGKNVVLMRDMTDTMYNPKRAPYVSHFTGTDLIVEHIEKFVCPTITSDQLLGGEPFRFANDRRPRLVIVMAETEYQTNVTLPRFAVEQLGKHFSIEYVFADDEDRNDLPGIEALDNADIALISVRRRVLPQAQMAAVERLLASGKPIAGIRTASHAFSLRGETPPTGYFALEDFDQRIFGGNYSNHHGAGPEVVVRAADGARRHPILAGVDLSNLTSHGSLYMVSPLAESTAPLLFGSIPDKPEQAVAWINIRGGGSRAFYTSMGHPDDFKSPQFNRFLRNAIYWMAGVEVSETVATGN